MKKILYLAVTNLCMAMAANSYGQEYRPGYLLQPNEFFDTQFEVLDSSGWF